MTTKAAIEKKKAKKNTETYLATLRQCAAFNLQFEHETARYQPSQRDFLSKKFISQFMDNNDIQDLPLNVCRDILKYA